MTTTRRNLGLEVDVRRFRVSQIAAVVLLIAGFFLSSVTAASAASSTWRPICSPSSCETMASHAASTSPGGYWFVASDGGIFSFGAPFYGSTGGIKLTQPIVGMAATPDGKGYWLVARDGGIFSFGDAGFQGSTGGIHLAQPIVAMATDPATGGYWLVASDGGIFSFNAPFYGSTGGIKLTQPIVGMAATPDGKGYWLVARDGGIFSFGDAGFQGSTGSVHLAQPIVAMATDPATGGYWLVASDGGIFSFNAPFYGSTGGIKLTQPIVGMAATPDGKGYWLVARDGGIFSFGDAGFQGSTGSVHLAQPIVAMAAVPSSVTTTPTPAPTPSPTPTPTPPAGNGTQLQVATSALPNANEGQSYATTLAATGGTSPYSWAIKSGSLPAGLSLSPAGQVTGTTSQVGTFTFTPQVTDSTSSGPQTATRTLSITVVPITSESPNWSGYIAANGPFSGVSGTFTVPRLSSNQQSGDAMGEWVGIDGASNMSLIQAGVAENPDPVDPTLFDLYAWWEILPALPVPIASVAVAPGDQVTVTIDQVSSGLWSIELTDDTNGQSFTTEQAYSGKGSSAEWIVEAPTAPTGITALAPFTPEITFTNLRISTPAAEIIRSVMVQAGNQLSTPSLLDTTGFNVAYGNSTPAAP